MTEPWSVAGRALMDKFYAAEEEESEDGKGFSLGCEEVLQGILAIEAELKAEYKSHRIMPHEYVGGNDTTCYAEACHLDRYDSIHVR